MTTKGKKGCITAFAFALVMCLAVLCSPAYAAELQEDDNENAEIAAITQEEVIAEEDKDENDSEEPVQIEAEEDFSAAEEQLPGQTDFTDVSDSPQQEDSQAEDTTKQDVPVMDEDDSESDTDAIIMEASDGDEEAVPAAESETEETIHFLSPSPMSEKEESEETEEEPEQETFVPFVRPIKDGTYVIVSKINGFKALQTEGASTAAGKPIEVQNCDGSDTQKFKLVSDAATGYYSITNVHSGKSLAVKGDAAKAGTAVVQNAASSSLGQKWIVVEKGGYYEIQSALDGTPLLLTLKNGSTANGTDVVLQEAKAAASQLFSFLVSKPSVAINEGVYEISSALDNTMKLDISGGSMLDKGNLQIYKSNGTPAQKFIVEKAGAGQYTITSYNSGKAMDVSNGSVAAKTNVQQYTKNGTPAQKWLIRNVGDGTVYITSAKSWHPLEVRDGKAASKTNVFVNTASGSTAQKFNLKKVPDDKLKPIANGVYLIQSAKNTNRVMAVEDGSRLQRANIQLQYNDNASFQKFKFIYAGKGYYKIQNVKSKHVLDVADGSMANKANIQQYHDNGTPAQLWLPHKNKDGSYTFVSAKTSKVLDAAGGSTADTTNIWAYRANNTPAQNFKLAKTSGSDNTAINYGKVKADPVLSAMYKMAQDYNSDTNYLVLCNITKHRVVLFKKNEGRWLSDMSTPVTVGSPYTPTPTGTFTVYNHWEYFDGGFGEPGSAYRCWWSTCFYGSYYFHSIIYYYNTGYPGRVMDGTLNANISHGCVRLPVDKAKYLYDHSPIGTKVRVYK